MKSHKKVLYCQWAENASRHPGYAGTGATGLPLVSFLIWTVISWWVTVFARDFSSGSGIDSGWKTCFLSETWSQNEIWNAILNDSFVVVFGPCCDFGFYCDYDCDGDGSFLFLSLFLFLFPVLFLSFFSRVLVFPVIFHVLVPHVDACAPFLCQRAFSQHRPGVP